MEHVEVDSHFAVIIYFNICYISYKSLQTIHSEFNGHIKFTT